MVDVEALNKLNESPKHLCCNTNLKQGLKWFWEEISFLYKVFVNKWNIFMLNLKYCIGDGNTNINILMLKIQLFGLISNWVLESMYFLNNTLMCKLQFYRENK